MTEAVMKNAFTIRNGVATVRLTQGMSMRVAEDALPLLAPHRWCARRGRRTWYAVTNVRLPDGRGTTLYIHRLLLGLKFCDPRQIDHLDGNGLNNTSTNLRVTDSTGNNHNQHGKYRRNGRDPTSRFPGVDWTRSRWRAAIGFAGRCIHIGYFDVEEDAAEAYMCAKAVRDAGGTEGEIKATRRR